MFQSKSFKMRTALACLLIMSFTLLGNQFLQNSNPKRQKTEKEEAIKALLEIEALNRSKVILIEQKFNEYELSRKSVESDTLH